MRHALGLQAQVLVEPLRGQAALGRAALAGQALAHHVAHAAVRQRLHGLLGMQLRARALELGLTLEVRVEAVGVHVDDGLPAPDRNVVLRLAGVGGADVLGGLQRR